MILLRIDWKQLKKDYEAALATARAVLIIGVLVLIVGFLVGELLGVLNYVPPVGDLVISFGIALLYAYAILKNLYKRYTTEEVTENAEGDSSGI